MEPFGNSWISSISVFIPIKPPSSCSPVGHWSARSHWQLKMFQVGAFPKWICKNVIFKSQWWSGLARLASQPHIKPPTEGSEVIGTICFVKLIPYDLFVWWTTLTTRRVVLFYSSRSVFNSSRLFSKSSGEVLGFGRHSYLLAFSKKTDRNKKLKHYWKSPQFSKDSLWIVQPYMVVGYTALGFA